MIPYNYTGFTPFTFLAGVELLEQVWQGAPISESPFKSNLADHQYVRDQMPYQDLFDGLEYMRKHIGHEYAKYINDYENKVYDELDAEATKRGERLTNVDMGHYYSIIKHITKNYDNRQKSQCKHHKAWWHVYTQVCTHMYRVKYGHPIPRKVTR